MREQVSSAHFKGYGLTKSKKMKIKNYILITLIGCGLFSSCTGVYENGKEMAADAKSVVDEITVDELKTKIEVGQIFHLIDIRTHEEFKRGYINDHFEYDLYLEPVNIPRGILEFRIADEGFWEPFYEDMPDKDSTEIIIYCKSGSRGILATETLLILGYKNVKNLSGGWKAWNPNQDDTEVEIEESGCGG